MDHRLIYITEVMIVRTILREPRKVVPLCIAALLFLTFYMDSSPCMIKVILYPIYREIKRESIIGDIDSFYVRSTENFNIYYKDVDYQCVKMVEDNAEISLAEVLKDLECPVDGKIDIIIYPRYEEMAGRIGLGAGSEAMGVYYGGTISILNPSRWIKNSCDMAETFKKEGPMVHEITHYLADKMSGGNIPVWFTEGLALYEEYKVNSTEWGRDKKYKDFYDAEELEEMFYELDEMKAYRQSFLAVKYIGDNFGMDAIDDIIRKLKAGKTIDQVVKSVLDMDVNQIFKRACR